MIKPLIYNSDIKEISKKASISFDEMALLSQAKLTESRIQQACKKIFEMEFGKGFVHIDNGGKMGIAQRTKKKLDGVWSGFPDVILLGKNGKIAFVEFKRIGAGKEIEPKEHQLEIHQFLRNSGFKVYVCNNTVYFKNVICKEFREYP